MSALLTLVGCGDDGARPRTDAAISIDAGDTSLDSAVTPTRFRIATWNTHDLFDSVDDREMDTVLSASAAAAKLAAIGRVILAMDADLVVLQEVEKMAVLDALADGPLAGAGYDQRGLIEGNDPRGIDIAYLSRIPIDFARSHAADRFPSFDGTRSYAFARDLLEIAAHPPSGRVLVFGAHLISQIGGTDADDHRLAETMEIRRIVDERVAAGAARIVVVGDLNDVTGAPALEPLVRDAALEDLTERVPAADRWTYVFSGDQRLYDHALGNARVASETADVRIVHGPEVDAASDHQPVIVDLALLP